MSIKIITLDLDGTLMSPDHLTVSEKNRKALKAAHDRGIKIAISTGRTLAIMGDVCQQVEDVDYIMYSNGAAVLDRSTNKNIYTNLMSSSLCCEMIDYLDSFHVFYEIYIDGFSYAPKNKVQYFDFSFLPKEFVDDLTSKITLCDNIKDTIGSKDVEKITVYCVPEQVFPVMWNHFDNMESIALTSSLQNNTEMTAATADKGMALRGICEALSISPEEAMAFGDAANDCPMLIFAGFSFAMGNGTDECKAAAKYITKSNGEDGVAHAIQKFILE